MEKRYYSEARKRKYIENMGLLSYRNLRGCQSVCSVLIITPKVLS